MTSSYCRTVALIVPRECGDSQGIPTLLRFLGLSLRLRLLGFSLTEGCRNRKVRFIPIFCVTVLLPAADFFRNAKQTGMLGAMIQSLTDLSHSPDCLKAIALYGFGAIVALLINWLFVKAVKWAFGKLNHWFGEDVVGTAFWFCMTLLPIALKAIHH